MAWQLADSAATDALAQQLAACLRAGDMVALHGEVGAGKTHFTRALIQHMQDTPSEVQSPSFTLVHPYAVRLADGVPVTLWHMDLYRLEAEEELEELGLDEALEEGIVVMEWPQLAQTWLPSARLELHWSIAPDGQSRSVRVEAGGDWSARLQHAGIATEEAA